MSLMRIGPAKAASSRRANDHSDQSGASVTRSSRTLVSTRTTSALAARHGHDLGRAQALAGMAAQAGETVRAGLLLDLDQNDATIGAALKIDHAAGFDSQQIANPLGDGDLALAGDGRAHGGSPVRRYYFRALLNTARVDFRGHPGKRRRVCWPRAGPPRHPVAARDHGGPAAVSPLKSILRRRTSCANLFIACRAKSILACSGPPCCLPPCMCWRPGGSPAAAPPPG